MRFLAISGPGVAQDEDFCPNCHVLLDERDDYKVCPLCQHNTRRDGTQRRYGSGGRQLTFTCHTNAIPSSGVSKPPVTRHWATVAGSSDHRSRRASGPLPQSNPVICRTIETLGRTNETCAGARHRTPFTSLRALRRLYHRQTRPQKRAVVWQLAWANVVRLRF